MTEKLKEEQVLPKEEEIIEGDQEGLEGADGEEGGDGDTDIVQPPPPGHGG